MNRLIKILNKFNGNLCFAGATDTGDAVFEVDRDGKTLSYDTSSKLVHDICLDDKFAYFVAFSDTFIGRYAAGLLNETYINTGLNSVDKIASDTQGNIYIFNRTDNQLVKYNLGVIWTFDLPDYSLKHEGNIVLRESDGVVIYYNNTNIHVVRDDTTKGTLLNSLVVSGSGDLKALISGEFNASYTYARVRAVTGENLDQSSSSSSSSSSSDSSASSSSSDSSNSSSESSESIGNQSSSSSSSSSLDSSSSSSSSLNDYVSVIPTLDSDHVKATSTVSTDYNEWFACDPSKSLTGPDSGQGWRSLGIPPPSGGAPQKFNIDLGSPYTIERVYYENFHVSGINVNNGIRAVTLYGTNVLSEFEDTVYANIPTGPVLWSGDFNKHVASDVADPNYIILSNSTPYQYYILRIASNYGSGVAGLRRIELQVRL